MAKRRKFPQEVADLVIERSQYSCEAQASPECVGAGMELHHRKLRSQGGRDEVPTMLHVCMNCHGFIHRNPAVSYEQGWLVRSMRDPGLAPVNRRGQDVLLLPCGGVEVAA